jgi:hypothetical protein
MAGLEGSIALTGDLKASAREDALFAFRRGEVPILLLSPEQALNPTVSNALAEAAMDPAQKPGELAFVARVSEPGTGRVLEVLSTEPGVQFYTANFLDGTLKGKGGWVYRRSNAITHQPEVRAEARAYSRVKEPSTSLVEDLKLRLFNKQGSTYTYVQSAKAVFDEASGIMTSESNR